MVLTGRGLCLLAGVLTVVDATSCTGTQMSNVTALVDEYRDDVSGSCDADLCSSDCVAIMTELAGRLPDCYENDVNNYFQRIGANVAACSDSDSGSAFDSSPTSIDDIFDYTCSSSQSSTVNSVMVSFGSKSEAACNDDYCSSDCQEVLVAIIGAIPNCLDTTDDLNYYRTVEGMMNACASASGSTIASGIPESSSDSSVSSASALAAASAGDNAADVASLSMVVMAIAGANLLL